MSVLPAISATLVDSMFFEANGRLAASIREACLRLASLDPPWGLVSFFSRIDEVWTVADNMSIASNLNKCSCLCYGRRHEPSTPYWSWEAAGPD